MRKRGGVLGILLATASGLTPLSAAPPQIGPLNPLALAPGKTVDLTLSGQNLQDARSLWTSFAARCEFVPAADESAQKGEKLACRVTVPRDEQVGIGAMRLVTGDGVSNPVLIMLDDLGTVAESANNHAAAEAHSIGWPIAVDGQCEPVLEDWYRFHAAAGERLSFEVVAQRIGSKLDPVLRLLTADGKELARVDDDAGAGGDSRLAHVFEAEGDYLLALGDVRHAGGGEFRYHLRVGAFPLVTAVYPAGGPSGAVMSFELVTLAAEAPSLLHVSLPVAPESPRLASFGVPAAAGAGSGWFQVEANPSGESLEAEPNDSQAEASPANLPGALNGRLDKPGDRDFFKFQGRKGQQVHCEALTRELGSPCDLYLSLHGADGVQIAVARQERQTVLDAEIPADGEYALRVEDLLVGGSPGHVYRVAVGDANAGFSLNAEQTQYSAPQAGTFVVKVLAQRRGYNGPIELAVEGLGDGVALEGQTFDGAETLLKITLPAGLPAGQLRHAKIVGKAKIGETMVTAAARQREPLLALFPSALSLPTPLETLIAVGVAAPFPPFFDLAVADSQLYFPQLVGESTFDVNISRKNDGFKDPVSLALEGLPAGVTAEVEPVEDGQKALRVRLKGPVDLPEGEFPVRIVGTAKFQEQTHKIALENLTLHIARPLVVKVAMAGPIVAGGPQQAVVDLLRFGAEPQPVRLQVSDGPLGLSAPIFVSIPADATHAEIPLMAAAEAPPGTYDNLVVVASTTVKGENVTVRSKPASVEIQPRPAEAPPEGLP